MSFQIISQNLVQYKAWLDDVQRLRTITSLDVSAVAGHHAMPAALLFFSILCHSYTGGNHKGTTAIVTSVVTILILLFSHKLPCGLKCVHSLLSKQEALAIMGQSLEKATVKCFSLKGGKCPYREYLLIICTTLAVPKTAPIERKASKIRHSF